MRDVVKTSVDRKRNSKRTRRRRRSMGAYYFLVLLLVAGIGVALSLTLFFNIDTIKVKGESDYQPEDIIKNSGIKNGDNLIRLDAEESSQKIIRSLIMVENVKINKKFPDTLEITVEKCVPTVGIEFENGYLITSASGKILEQTESMPEGLVKIEGFEPKLTEPGTALESEDKTKNKIFSEFLDNMQENENNIIVSVNMEDKYSIQVNFDDRITFDMGNSNDIKYKLELAESVLADLSEDKEGYMMMVGNNQISFRNKSDVAQKDDDKIPISEEDMPDDSMLESINDSRIDSESSAEGQDESSGE